MDTIFRFVVLPLILVAGATLVSLFYRRSKPDRYSFAVAVAAAIAYPAFMATNYSTGVLFQVAGMALFYSLFGWIAGVAVWYAVLYFAEEGFSRSRR